MGTEKLKSKIETIMTWEGGQRLFNFAYSVGAAIVIWGALFKILHLPGGNTLLCIGMGTEVLMFILTAFDRPPKEYHWEEVFPELEGRDAERRAVPMGQSFVTDRDEVVAKDFIYTCFVIDIVPFTHFITFPFTSCIKQQWFAM